MGECEFSDRHAWDLLTFISVRSCSQASVYARGSATTRRHFRAPVEELGKSKTGCASHRLHLPRIAGIAYAGEAAGRSRAGIADQARADSDIQKAAAR